MGQMKLFISLSLPKTFLHNNLVALLIFRVFFPPSICVEGMLLKGQHSSQQKSKSKMNCLFLTGQVSIELILHNYSMCCTNQTGDLLIYKTFRMQLGLCSPINGKKKKTHRSSPQKENQSLPESVRSLKRQLLYSNQKTNKIQRKFLLADISNKDTSHICSDGSGCLYYLPSKQFLHYCGFPCTCFLGCLQRFFSTGLNLKIKLKI